MFPPDSSPFISSVARHEVDRYLRWMRLLVCAMALVIIVQCGVIIALVATR